MKKFLFVLAALAIFAVGCSGAESADSDTPVPDVVGHVLPDAESTLEDAGFSVEASDAVEDRMILNKNNWTVVSQQPAAGTTGVETVQLGVRNERDGDEGDEGETADTAVDQEEPVVEEQGMTDVEFFEAVKTDLEAQGSDRHHYITSLESVGNFLIIHAQINSDESELAQAICGQVLSASYSYDVPWSTFDVEPIDGGRAARCERADR